MKVREGKKETTPLSNPIELVFRTAGDDLSARCEKEGRWSGQYIPNLPLSLRAYDLFDEPQGKEVYHVYTRCNDA